MASIKKYNKPQEVKKQKLVIYLSNLEKNGTREKNK
jgi:hypothetical protein